MIQQLLRALGQNYLTLLIAVQMLSQVIKATYFHNPIVDHPALDACPV